MWRSITTAVAAALAIVAVIGSITLAATAQAQRAEPQVITLAQDVPVEVVFALPQDDGSAITVTAPITVGLNVQVTVQGPLVVDVQAAAQPGTGEAGAAGQAGDATDSGTGGAGAAAGGELTDARGIPYDVQAPDGLAVQQVTSKEMLGSTQLVGQIKNTGATARGVIMVSISLFDADGQLIDVATGFAQATKLEPGKTTTFTALANTPVEEVARYSVQVEAMQ